MSNTGEVHQPTPDVLPAIPPGLRAQLCAPRTRRCVVTARDIRRFNQAIGEPDDGDGLVAAPLFCQTLTWEEVPLERLPADGSPAELDVPIPATRVVGGSSEYVIHRLVRAGDELDVVSVLKDVRAKEGRSGLVYLVVIETRCTDRDGRPVATEVATFVKRP
jgi:hydroxyacyl-ACP dehydratase HTD2-like protein with hotdog domain